MDDIREQVEEVLRTVCADNVKLDAFLQARDELVRMIIVSVAPPLKRSNTTGLVTGDWSKEKEGFVAP